MLVSILVDVPKPESAKPQVLKTGSAELSKGYQFAAYGFPDSQLLKDYLEYVDLDV